MGNLIIAVGVLKTHGYFIKKQSLQQDMENDVARQAYGHFWGMSVNALYCEKVFVVIAAENPRRLGFHIIYWFKIPFWHVKYGESLVEDNKGGMKMRFLFY